MNPRRLLVVLALLTACSDPPAPKPPIVPDPIVEPPPPLAPALPPAPPELVGPSCSNATLGTCTEYPPTSFIGSLFDAESSCSNWGGVWASSPCPRAGAAGVCLVGAAMDRGSVLVLDRAHHPSDVESEAMCLGGFDGRWLPLAASAEAPPPPEPPPPPPAEPSYRFTAPDGYDVWALAPTPSRGMNLEAYRSQRGYGPTDAHVTLFVRREALLESEIADALTIDPHDFEASGVELASHRTTSSAGAPGVQFETLSDFNGERLRVLQLFVLAGTYRFRVICGSIETTRATWMPACDRAIRSFHVVE